MHTHTVHVSCSLPEHLHTPVDASRLHVGRREWTQERPDRNGEILG